jgi:hypothetical protein
MAHGEMCAWVVIVGGLWQMLQVRQHTVDYEIHGETELVRYLGPCGLVRIGKLIEMLDGYDQYWERATKTDMVAAAAIIGGAIYLFSRNGSSCKDEQ